ncbi:type I restriction endonuclease subunit R [Parafilimonas sp.]|uniref:type I restriction endonuclease subunit R n=1 Tax=Parafilimonas sp. TaxID=1969739 RepID=UPI003F8018F3
MKKYLSESAVEEAAIEWLKEIKPYHYKHGEDIHRPLNKAVLEDIFTSFLQNKFKHVPAKVLEEVKQEFLFNSGSDIHTRNHEFHKKLSKGFSKEWKDDNGKYYAEHFYAVDFETISNNDFLIVNQFTIDGKNKRRPDLIVFINGLPLVLFEFKDWFNKDADVETAFNQIQHYIQDIPQVFEYNALTVISDGQTTLHGMFSSGMEWFAAWKSVDGINVVQNDFALETLIKGLLVPERLLQYIRFYIFHELDKGQLIKKGAKYHQFFGVQYALEETKKAIKPFGDGRIGVIWHTTRSGKSITMAIYSGILRQMPELKNPTIVVQVDRFDLNKQLYEDFIATKDLVGDVSLADNSDDLRSLLSGEGGGVIFSTIEKFRLQKTEEGKEASHPVLSTRDNIIVIADECHRTQYGLLQGFAANLRTALPNASFIGFTGTPVDTKDADTVAVFGEVIHTYDIKQATEDNAVVPIYYEPRLAKLHLGNAQIEEEAEEIVGAVTDKDRNKILWAAAEDAAGADKRVAEVSKDILHHYIERSKTLEGKAMIVCMSRRNCVKMYDALMKLEGCPEIAVIMTSNIAKDPKGWNPHICTKEKMEAIKARFKDPDDPLKIVIVRDMWLTGFDNPPLHTLYVDKIMSGHNLIQAINRVATVFKDKPSGLIVDYIGIGDKLRDATKKYTGSGGKGDVVIDVDEAFETAKEFIAALQKSLPANFDYSKWLGLSKGNQLKLVSDATNHIVSDEEASKDFMLNELKMSGLASVIKGHPNIQTIALDIIFLQHVGAAVRKIKNPSVNIRKKEGQIKELIHRSIESEEVVDVFTMAGIPKFDISIINDDFLATAKEQKSGYELKLELVRKILNEEIKLRQFKNIVKYKKLREEVEKIIEDYHNHFFDSLIALQKLRGAAKAMQEEDERRKVLGLTDEEEAFYEILVQHKNAISDYALIKEIVKDVTAAIKKSLQIDWYKKPDARAQIMLAVKRVLQRKGVSQELQDILNEIMEQAEARYKEWWGEVA